MRLRQLLERLRGLGLEPREEARPRIREARSYVLVYRGEPVARLLVFTGRPPYYRAWIELYSIRWDLLPREKLGALLEALADALEEPGERIFIEYAGLEEVDRMLQQGTPPEETPLGRVLASRGLRLRDMYFPEGFMEGGPKLVAEKPA